MPPLTDLAAWAIAGASIAGLLVRPFGLPEAVWAVLGAALLLAFGLLPFAAGLQAVGRGTDVYLFLIGMMLLSEVARREGLFDWLAAFAVNHARGSPRRLFLLVYGVGTVVTAFLSNDAAAVVLTPAVFAVTRAAKAPALPYLFICAFIANAASFVLPISNPANLVLYGDHVPPLGRWLSSFALPSLLAIVATWAALRFNQRHALAGGCEAATEQPRLSGSGRAALAGLLLTAAALLVVSWLDRPLGAPTCLLGVMTAVAVLLMKRASPWPLLKQVSWSVLPLVAGLFVLVEALNATGVVGALTRLLEAGLARSVPGTSAAAAVVVALGSNLVNNLPAGLVASTAIAAARPPQVLIDAVLIAVDLGPNLSITGSLATILWTTALRREGVAIGFWRFLMVGALVMPPALVLAVGARLLWP